MSKREQEIIAAAAKVFKEKGYHAATVREPLASASTCLPSGVTCPSTFLVVGRGRRSGVGPKAPYIGRAAASNWLIGLRPRISSMVRNMLDVEYIVEST